MYICHTKCDARAEGGSRDILLLDIALDNSSYALTTQTGTAPQGTMHACHTANIKFDVQAEGASRDVLLLDIALDNYFRLCIERTDKNSLSGDDLLEMVGLVLKNAVIAGESEDFGQVSCCMDQASMFAVKLDSPDCHVLLGLLLQHAYVARQISLILPVKCCISINLVTRAASIARARTLASSAAV